MPLFPDGYCFVSCRKQAAVHKLGNLHRERSTCAAMIIEYEAVLSQRKILLASGSPRRREILTLMGLPFTVSVSNFEENLDKSLFAEPYEYVLANATGKARDVATRESGADLVVGCDTIVVLDGYILEKPKSEGDSFQMLRALSGRSHTVISGVALFAKGRLDKPVSSFFEETTVWFAELSDAAIAAYIRSGEPADKAGSYGIQGLGGSFIRKVRKRCRLIWGTLCSYDRCCFC